MWKLTVLFFFLMYRIVSYRIVLQRIHFTSVLRLYLLYLYLRVLKLVHVYCILLFTHTYSICTVLNNVWTSKTLLESLRRLSFKPLKTSFIFSNSLFFVGSAKSNKTLKCENLLQGEDLTVADFSLITEHFKKLYGMITNVSDSCVFLYFQMQIWCTQWIIIRHLFDKYKSCVLIRK